MKKKLLQLMLLSVVVTPTTRGFIHLSTTPTHPTTRSSLLLLQLKMVGGGGKGWDNNSYLDNLGGDEDDLNKSKQDYEEFHDRQQAFIKRQEERMKSPQMQAFLKQQQQQAEQSWLTSDANSDDDVDSEDEYADLGGSSGGSRFRHMMQQQSKLQRAGNNKDQLEFNSMFGEQKFVVPLDDDDDEEEEENNEMEGN